MAGSVGSDYSVPLILIDALCKSVLVVLLGLYGLLLQMAYSISIADTSTMCIKCLACLFLCFFANFLHFALLYYSTSHSLK